nr:hypothetical protein BaRGS_034168 [Batillaria attramentaria]
MMMEMRIMMLLTELPHVVRDMRPGAPNNNRNERQPCGKCSVGRVVRAFGAYAYGYILVTLITVVLKLSTGQLRPHFLAVCKPDVDLSNCTGYIESYQCTNENATARELKSARESFPSGHASMMFYCATFLVLYLETRIHVVNTRLPKLTLQAGMVTAALYVSVTRITDHHHHRTDVIVGALLGIIVAIVTFTQVARHWINDHKAAEADRDSQNCNNSSTDIDTESADPTTPTPLLSRNGLGEKAGSSGALLGPLRLHIP